MNIVEIKTLPNGSHRNIFDASSVPDGWAFIPDDLYTPNFPFGSFSVTEIDGVTTVSNWVAGTMPKADESEIPVSAIEQLRADVDYLAIMTEVKL